MTEDLEARVDGIMEALRLGSADAFYTALNIAWPDRRRIGIKVKVLPLGKGHTDSHLSFSKPANCGGKRRPVSLAISEFQGALLRQLTYMPDSKGAFFDVPREAEPYFRRGPTLG